MGLTSDKSSFSAWRTFAAIHIVSSKDSDCCLITLLHEGLPELEFYDDLLYKFRKIVDKTDLSEQLKKIVTRYKTLQYGYSVKKKQQTNCMHDGWQLIQLWLMIFTSLFNCTTVSRSPE